MLLAAALVPPAAAQPPWYGSDARGEPVVELYFFWAHDCPHCNEARPFVERLPIQYPWLRLRSAELTSSEANVRQYAALAASLGREASAVPAFLFCGEMIVGYESDATTGEQLRRRLATCHERRLTQGGAPPPAAETSTRLPLLGDIDPKSVSLPLTTLILAALDAFNPCAFFVLLFLLSLLVHARSRARMAFVGGVFVLFSGLVYFAFMAAWLNVFLWAGELRYVTAAAGGLALAIGFVNVKDFFWFRRGVTLSIPDSAKPGLFRRMRALVAATSWPSLVAGSVLLAAAANTYELLCTAGFPMVFTRILTLHGLSPARYYLYLAFYNLIYVIPLALIVVVFTVTLGARKLSEEQGRALKLLSGLMMLGLGALLLAAPQWLNNPFAAAGLLAAALTVTALARRVRRA